MDSLVLYFCLDPGPGTILVEDPPGTVVTDTAGSTLTGSTHSLKFVQNPNCIFIATMLLLHVVLSETV